MAKGEKEGLALADGGAGLKAKLGGFGDFIDGEGDVFAGVAGRLAEGGQFYGHFAREAIDCGGGVGGQGFEFFVGIAAGGGDRLSEFFEAVFDVVAEVFDFEGEFVAEDFDAVGGFVAGLLCGGGEFAQAFFEVVASLVGGLFEGGGGVGFVFDDVEGRRAHVMDEAEFT